MILTSYFLKKQAPTLLDNLTQAFLMAPFFVLLEVNFDNSFINFKKLFRWIEEQIFYIDCVQSLQMLFHYEPYPGFHATVKARVEAEIKEWQDKKLKKIS